MRQHQFTALGLALALVLGACGPDEQDLSTPDPDETPVAEQAPTDAPANGDEDIPEAEPFESPVVEEDEATMAAPSGLISSTNPQERSRQVQRNLDAARDDGADPFGILPVEVSRSQRQAETVTREVTGEPEPGATDTDGGRRTGNGEGTQRTNGTNGGAPGTPTAGPGGQTADAAAAEEPPGPPLPPLPMQTVNPLPDLPFESAATPRFAPEPTPVPQVPQTPPTPPTPPPPTADTAEAIEVSGVMQIGNEVQIILRTPGSVNSQYVRIGQNIAGGRVVVRRVENLATGSPLVILEENGIEVARAVGDAPVTPVGDEENGNGRSDFIRQVPSSDLSSGTRTLAPPPQLES